MINKYTSADNYRALTTRIVKIIRAGHYGTEVYWYLVDKREAYLTRTLTEGVG